LETSEDFLDPHGAASDADEFGGKVTAVSVRFGDWTFDTETRQLHRGVENVHLTTKAFELLRLLIEARPRVLAKSDLQDTLWPGVFVSETNLFTLISEIRAAIEDDARHPRFVRTVHGVGYAFSGEATPVSGDATRRVVATASWVLVWEERQFPLAVGERIIGRDPDVDVTLESTTVSRRHARLQISADAATIEDLGSKNGTFVNDRRIVEPAAVTDSDRIRIGSLVTRLRRVGPTSSTETEHAKTD
jgi:DNA-binding winged helix-turn-helix (wHTH) protein